jgi:LmbE family N-acetylglucosaminyl deacetylase
VGGFLYTFTRCMLEHEIRFRRQWLSRPTIVVAAHPDDEIIGLGTLLPKLQRLQVVIHLTDGAPRTGPDIQNAGCRDWLEYAALRRKESEQAFTKAGLPPVQRICLWCPDQQAAFAIARNAIRLAFVFRSLRPAFVFTHSYEGGHPDHDACAAAVHGAVGLLKSSGRVAPRLLEFASYHLGGCGMETECFVSHSKRPPLLRTLSPEEREVKLRLLSCFTSQQNVLAGFPCASEPIRVAPTYNFARPPYMGKLFYEQFDWGVNGRQWRRLAKQALTKLGVSRQQ